MTPLAALDRLDALASKATPGKRRQDGRLIMEDDGSENAIAMVNIARNITQAHADAGLIAALDPATVASLVACVRAGIAMRVACYSNGHGGARYHQGGGCSTCETMIPFDAALAALGGKP